MADGFRVVLDNAAVSLFADECGADISAIIGPMMKRGAQGRAPVRTGDLLRSIDWRHVPGPGGGSTELSAVFYDLFLELPARQIKTPIRTLRDSLIYDVPKLL